MLVPALNLSNQKKLPDGHQYLFVITKVKHNYNPNLITVPMRHQRPGWGMVA